jgi:hypothetical protein
MAGEERKMSEVSELKAMVSALAHRVDALEDINAIRKLHFSYGYLIDYCRYDDVVQLFTEDGEVLFLSGIYKGHESIARLYKNWFQQFFLQGREGPIDGFLLDHFQMQDIITVSDDRKTAKGRFRTLLAGGNHESRPDKPVGLPDQFYEAGIYENEYVREGGVWKIKRLDYIVEWQAEYEKGWTHTISHLQPATACYPENPLGPDVLLDEKRPAWPYRGAIKYHYAHPVTGRNINR